MIRNILLLITFSVVLVGSILYSAPTYAAPTAQSQAACDGANDGSVGVSCTDDSSGLTVSVVVKTAIRIFQAVIGIISVFSMLIGGLNYITSGGDAGKTKTARERIMYAVIGLVIVGLAEIIVQFALNRAYGL